MNVPLIYGLKKRYLRRDAAPHWADLGPIFQNMAAAPVFICGPVPFDTAAECDEFRRIVSLEHNDGIFMPFPHYLIQAQDHLQIDDGSSFGFFVSEFECLTVVAQWIYGEIGGHGPEWSELLGYKIFNHDEKEWRININPACPKDFAERVQAIFGAAEIAACFLKHGAGTEKESMSTTRRRVCAARGITGTVYRIIGVAEVASAMRQARGGTHASPRHHMRRSHVRRLKSGTVVQVRACEVGDKTRGAVVKDYTIMQRGANNRNAGTDTGREKPSGEIA